MVVTERLDIRLQEIVANHETRRKEEAVYLDYALVKMQQALLELNNQSEAARCIGQAIRAMRNVIPS